MLLKLAPGKVAFIYIQVTSKSMGQITVCEEGSLIRMHTCFASVFH